MARRWDRLARPQEEPGARERPPWSVHRVVNLVLLALLLVAGTILFTQQQEQQIFRDASTGLQEELSVRADAGILLGAGLVAFSATLLLRLFASFRATWRPFRLLGFFALLVILLLSHATIFVNGVILPGSGQAVFTASFLYHESPALNLPALASITLFSLLVAIPAVLLAYSLLFPRGYRRHLGLRGAPEAVRGRANVLWLAILLPLLFFSWFFFHTGLEADEGITPGFLNTNLILLFYLASGTLLVLALLLSIRHAIILWGPRRGPGPLLRVHQTVASAENWVIPLIVLILGLAALVPPEFASLPVEGNLVFATNARGAATFLVLLAIPYEIHRATTRTVARTAARVSERERRAEVLLAGTVLATFVVLLPALSLTVGAPITAVALSVAIGGGLLLAHSLRFQLRGGIPQLVMRHGGAVPYVLGGLLFTAIAGLMLWGIGNTVQALYYQSGSFLVLQGSELQPYATLFKFGGSALLALPVTLALALKVRGGPGKYGPLLLIPMTLIVGMILYFSITTESIPAPDLGSTDVRVGFTQIGLTVTDTVALTITWALLAMLLFMSLGWLIQRTRDGVSVAAGERIAGPARV